MSPYYKKQLKKVILEYCNQSQRYIDFRNLLFKCHEELIANDQLVAEGDGFYKTRIMGNE